MRVTNNMMVNLLNYNLSKNLGRMSEDQKHLASGRRIHKASDDPIGASKVLKYRTDISEFNQYETNVRDALNWLEVSESAVADTGEALQRARELAVQAANGTNAVEDLQKISDEIKNLKEHLISNGNFSFAGKYVFSGYQTDRPLFKADGTYNVDITDGDYKVPPRMKLLIGTGETLQTSTSGIDLFGVVTTPNAFSTMFTDTAGDQLASNKSAIKGQFSLTTAYSGDTLDVTIGGVTYDVNEVAFDGTTAIPLDRDVVIDRFRQALAGGVGPGKLLDVANVYFDNHDNLVIENKAPGIVAMSTSATNFKPAGIYTGDIAKKSILKGPFALSGPTADYSVQNLDVVVGGSTYVVDETTLNGQAFTVTKDMVVKQFREALVGGVGPAKLSEVADIYFDNNDELVIKEKAYGANPISIVGAPIPGYTTSLQLGQGTTEASVDFNQFTFNDAFVAANEAEIKATPLYITYNGTRRPVYLDPAAIITTTAQYQTTLQNALDKSFGAGKVSATLGGVAPAQYFNFATVGTVNGKQPEIRVEAIKSKQSAIIEDFNRFEAALNNKDLVEIQAFLSRVDGHLNRVLSVRADIGAKVNRMELVMNRITSNQVSFAGMLSDVEDVDMAETIMNLKNAENVYRSSLSTGGRIIQPTLMDFLR